MKKLSVSVSVLMAIVMLALSGCASNKLADIYSEEEVVAKAKEVVDVINTSDYEAINDVLREDLKTQLTAEQIEEAWAGQLTEAGKFEEYTTVATAGQKSQSTEEDFAVAVLVCKYENAKLTYTVVLDKDLEVVGLYMK